MSQRRVIWIMLGMLTWMSCVGPACAADQQTPPPQQTVCPICGRVSNAQAHYGEKATGTLARGVTNTIFGWTELIRQPADEVKAGGNVLTGIGKGVTHSITRTFGGLGEVLTFWTPKVNKHYIHFAEDCPLCMKSTHQ